MDFEDDGEHGSLLNARGDAGASTLAHYIKPMVRRRSKPSGFSLAQGSERCGDSRLGMNTPRKSTVRRIIQLRTRNWQRPMWRQG
jgi:Flp pilus assembly CpaE family ATPase